MKSILNLFLIGAFLLSPTFSEGAIIKLENGIDLPKGMYLKHYNQIESANRCMKICKSTNRCVAFTWVRPGVQGPTGVCWLKSTTGYRVKNSCCISGIVSIPKPGFGGFLKPGYVKPDAPPGTGNLFGQ